MHYMPLIYLCFFIRALIAYDVVPLACRLSA